MCMSYRGTWVFRSVKACIKFSRSKTDRMPATFFPFSYTNRFDLAYRFNVFYEVGRTAQPTRTKSLS